MLAGARAQGMMPTTTSGGMTERLGFLIVGTPRSGTTLVQRLASELPGVRVPPETHFFPLFGRDLLRRRTFPLDGQALEQEIQRYLDLQTSRGMDLSVTDVAHELGGRCGSVVDLFVAIVCRLAGEGEVYGEKTPNHLLWWRPLTRVLPHLRIIAVVRDPRAVVNSYAAAPFGMDSPAALAESWVSDQGLVLAAMDHLGRERCLVLRYEDVVARPEATRDRLRRFLVQASALASVPEAAPSAAQDLFMSWEAWKADAVGPVVRDRVDAWRQELPAKQASVVSAICGRTMRAFAYPTDPIAGSPSDRRSVWTLGPADQWRRLHFRIVRARRIREIVKTQL
jgi:Sulfotransferase family